MGKELTELSLEIGQRLRALGQTFSTAESCTGGNIATVATSVPGSSEYFKGGIVAYSNEVKVRLLDVRPETLAVHGAVSEETVREMAKGAMESLKTDYAVATSGIAGPGGGSKEKPVGTIWMAAVSRKKLLTFRQNGDDGREKNVARATENALKLLNRLLEEEISDSQRIN